MVFLNYMYYYLNVLCICNVHTFDHFKYSLNILYILFTQNLAFDILHVSHVNKINWHIRFWNVMICGWVICMQKKVCAERFRENKSTNFTSY